MNDAVHLVHRMDVCLAGRIAMLLPSRMAGRTLGLHGPDLARGPEVARHNLAIVTVYIGRLMAASQRTDISLERRASDYSANKTENKNVTGI